jgi:hypothetical protein
VVAGLVGRTCTRLVPGLYIGTSVPVPIFTTGS